MSGDKANKTIKCEAVCRTCSVINSSDFLLISGKSSPESNPATNAERRASTHQDGSVLQRNDD